jgi:hypothetical protein
MIIDTIRGDVFKTPHKHIAFAVNTEGHNDAGFAGAVSSKYWPALESTGAKKPGEVLQKSAAGKTFHALVCHSLGGDSWKKTPELVAQCLDKLEVPDDEPIAVVLMGAGMIGQMGGADVFSIMGGHGPFQEKGRHLHPLTALIRRCVPKNKSRIRKSAGIFLFVIKYTNQAIFYKVLTN